MAVDVQNRSWPAVNLTRSYPVVPWASRADVTGAFELPDDLLVELYFPIAASLDVSPTRFYVRRVAAYANGVSVTIGYDDNAGGQVVGTATISRSSFAPLTPILLPGAGNFAGATGKLVFGRLDGLDLAGAGQYDFAPAATQLSTDCIRPQLGGISSLRVLDGNGAGAPLTGTVGLVAGANFRITAVDSSTLRLDAISGEGLNEDCSCSGLPATATPIASINGISAPTLNFVGDGCLSVSAAGSTIALHDTCSSPCCGCTEKEAFQAALDTVNEKIRELRDFQTRLQSEVSKMTNVVIASRVNDTGCITCD